MGVEYSHYILLETEPGIKIDRVIGILQSFCEEGMLDNEEIQFLINPHESQDQKQTINLQKFIVDGSNIEGDFRIDIDLYESSNSEKYTRIFKQNTFMIEDVEDLYGHTLSIIGGNRVLLPFGEQVLDIIHNGKSIYSDFDVESSIHINIAEKISFMDRIFNKGKQTKVLSFNTMPFLHSTEGNKDEITILFRLGYTGEEVEITIKPYYFAFCINMGKCLPKEGLNGLELTDTFRSLLINAGYKNIIEFSVFH
ncbi:hypothetical protein Back11_54840 [Paenibacillus baekrokdamisoli]|uniref:Uncharacterized protein n=1 Tax=Paenibacillus baekrokdamisoli TaxID=1712516 RepID=A0A3G9JM89_9BACL|nr:hypothetical protein [Paenibacillus baekrokdamisoli]MBB3071878.1 hypothetical protein [Paenibacillus baekrokdamisoli]BBH24139.1 hypothetical protein Back11_54840 [Paenibacillus baekrokdamisoli]